jgi:hypothetical protein
MISFTIDSIEYHLTFDDDPNYPSLIITQVGPVRGGYQDPVPRYIRDGIIEWDMYHYACPAWITPEVRRYVEGICKNRAFL